MNLGRAIKELRKEKGWSQGELAQRVGLSQMSVSHIERGAKTPSSKNLARIIKELGTTEMVLRIMAFEREDVPLEKRLMFDEIQPVIKKLINLLT